MKRGLIRMSFLERFKAGVEIGTKAKATKPLYLFSKSAEKEVYKSAKKYEKKIAKKEKKAKRKKK